MIKRLIIPIVAIASVLATRAEVRLPSILCDGMVVQRDAPVRLWGWSDPGEKFDVKFDGRKVASAEADASGYWQLETMVLAPGGPYTISVGDKLINDVLCGDVLLCSGQSNMELPVRRVMELLADEVDQDMPQVRQYVVPKEFCFDGPCEDTKAATWCAVDPNTVMRFSALAYFTAKELTERTGLPVGIINASWGGTPIESWISETALAENYPYAIAQKSIYNDAAYRQHIKDVEAENGAHWAATLYASDKGANGKQKWHDPNLDDSEWTTYDLFSTDWNSDAIGTICGSHWLRRTVSVSENWVGEPVVLRLGAIVDADSVFVNGTLVGTTSYQYPPRIYKVPAGVFKSGDNNITVRVISHGNRAHFVPEKEYSLTCGHEKLSLEGDWKYHLGARMPSPSGSVTYYYMPAVLYNSMISPILNYPVSGVVWYQGESNVGRRSEYASLLELMASDWRSRAASAQMPFYIVELADFLHPSDVGGRRAWAEMRQAQAAAAEAIPNAVLIPNSDLGEWNDIHPQDKKTLGIRVANAILGEL